MDTPASELLRELNSQAGQRGFSLLGRLRELRQNPAIWSSSPDLYAWFAHQLVRAGSLTTALNLVRCGKRVFPNDHRLWLSEVVTLTRSGNLDEAKICLQKIETRFRVLLATNGEFASDVLCQWGRVYQGRCYRESSHERKAVLARNAADSFASASARMPQWHYPMVCHALMRHVSAEHTYAERLAKQSIRLATVGFEHHPDEAGWRRAALCLAHLILGNETEARQFYFDASRTFRARGDFGSLSSLNRDLRFLRGRFSSLENQTVLAFAGHLVDQPNWPKDRPPRFPVEDGRLQGQVAEEIRENLTKLRPIAAYCSLAAGSDILFAEQVLANPERIELHVVLPFNFQDFLSNSVDFSAQHPQALERYELWSQRATRIKEHPEVQVHYATRERLLDDRDLMFSINNRFTQGLALMRAEEMCVEPVALVVLDRDSAPRMSGTGYFLNQWRSIPHIPRRYVQIDLACLKSGEDVCSFDEARRGAPPPYASVLAGATEDETAPRTPVEKPVGANVQHRVECSMLFADIVKYSQIPDRALLPFMSAFFGIVTQLRGEFLAQGVKAIDSNTWGDALYSVFSRPEQAADFASQLLERLEDLRTQPTLKQSKIQVRIGLHAGPVFDWPDAVRDCKSFAGRHISQAARVEQVAEANSIYCTEQFAALLTFSAGDRFRCERVGVTRLPKEFGRAHLYRVVRIHNSSTDSPGSKPAEPSGPATPPQP